MILITVLYYGLTFDKTTVLSMIICVCNNVSESDIDAAVANGAQSINQLSQKTGLGTGCGGCLETAKSLLNGRLDALLNDRPDLFYAA